MTKILSAADILGADDVKTTTVEVPEWGGSVIVREMTGTDRDAFEGFLVSRDVKDELSFRALLVACSAIDENGKRLFTVDQVNHLGRKNARALDRVFAAANELSKVTGNAVEEAQKN